MYSIESDWLPFIAGETPSQRPVVAFPEASCVVRHREGRPNLDLGRDVHALFGLVFDAVSVAEAADQLVKCAMERTPCFFSTPNLNFAVGTQSDEAFRGSVLRSDLSLADGMPIVWAARWMGLPIRERVAGSDLFEYLAARPLPPGTRPIRVFFFGGPDGAAELAAETLNRTSESMTCVGFESPGFVSVEEMSRPEQIDRINASGADFVLVALGAKKGQEWIERNRGDLFAPLVSHLGAVLNFVAGTVRRAPIWMQRSGLEWIWRIREEPALFRRYFFDGFKGLRLGVTQILFWPLLRRLHALFRPSVGPATYKLSREGGSTVFHLSGSWVRDSLAPLRQAVAKRLNRGEVIQFDLSGRLEVDGATIGLLLLLDCWQQEARAILPTCKLSSSVRAALWAHGALGLLKSDGFAVSGAKEHAERRAAI